MAKPYQASSASHSRGFRSDLNGLRALAVVSVVLFHFQFPAFSGGFAGVDIFFVISGFLMTRIILSGLMAENFSLSQFYLARARRIVPALLVLCGCLLLIGWFWLPDTDYRRLATHAACSLVFVSNMRFLKEAGYFDVASHDKWLLHTWSLSVEWQFYLLFPLLLLLLWRSCGIRGSIRIMCALAGLSFAWSVYATTHSPSSAFYLLTSRAWEMLAGGLVWCLSCRYQPSVVMSRVYALVGLGLIGLAILGFNNAMTWPGRLAAVPVLGAMGVLLAARPDSWWLSNPLSQWLGSSSYSIYLWHWPLVVLLVYGDLQTQPLAITLALSATLVLGYLSYRFIETPGRMLLGQLPPPKSSLVLLGAVLLVAVPALVLRNINISGRLEDRIELVAKESQNENPRRKACLPGTGAEFPLCHFGGSQIDAILLGDSHAMAVSSAMTAAQSDAGRGFTLLAYSSCPIVEGAKRFGPGVDSNHQCAQFNTRVQEYVKSQPTTVPVVVINRGSLYPLGYGGNSHLGPLVYFDQRYDRPEPAFLANYREHLVQSSCQLAQTHPVYLMRPIPEMPVEVANRMTRDLMWGREASTVSISLAEYHARHQFIWAAQDEAVRRCGVKILDPLPYLCHAGRCWGSKEGRPLYYDKDHLSEYGNKLLTPLFRQVLAQQAVRPLPGSTVARPSLALPRNSAS
jgi:peptidoglycan/LPS O-acetylase OafA/YrhL